MLSNSTAKIIISYVIRGPFLMEKVHLWTKSERLVDMSKIVKQWLLCLCCHAAGPKHVTRKAAAIECHVRHKKNLNNVCCGHLSNQGVPKMQCHV